MVVYPQAAGLVLALLALAVARPDLPSAAAWATAGVSGPVGLAAFYRGLAVGTMSLVAPIAAVRPRVKDRLFVDGYLDPLLARSRRARDEGMARRFRPLPESNARPPMRDLIPDNARPPMRDLIPDDDTLAALSAMAALVDRGEPVSVDALEAEVRAVSGRSLPSPAPRPRSPRPGRTDRCRRCTAPLASAAALRRRGPPPKTCTPTTPTAHRSWPPPPTTGRSRRRRRA